MIFENVGKVLGNLDSIFSLPNVDLADDCPFIYCRELLWPTSLKVLFDRIDLF